MSWLRRWLDFNVQPLWFRLSAPPLLLAAMYAVAFAVWWGVSR